MVTAAQVAHGVGEQAWSVKTTAPKNRCSNPCQLSILGNKDIFSWKCGDITELVEHFLRESTIA